MRRHIREYLAACPVCVTHTPAATASPKGKLPTPSSPFDTLHVDLVGPFQRDRHGRQYLLTIIDSLTGFADAIPIASKKTATIQHELAHFFYRYGLPRHLITDHGQEFQLASFQDWLREQGIQQHLTSAYHPRANGKVQWFNATIQAMLLRLCGSKPKQWSKFLPEALFAYRTNPTQANVTPF